MGEPTISLLHATFRRSGGPLQVRDAWLDSAKSPDTVEYVPSMDGDDEISVRWTAGMARVVNPPPIPGTVTAVRNWNAAASISRGTILIVIADDLFPPPAWDEHLLELAGGLDPARVAYAIKVTDSAQHVDVQLRHPVISRAFYKRLGLFSEAYQGVYCDRDFTLRAYWRSVILDGRSLELRHLHPTIDPLLAASESQKQMNEAHQYAIGERAFSLMWDRRHRTAEIRLVPAPVTVALPRGYLALRRWHYHLATDAHYAARRARHLLRVRSRLRRARQCAVRAHVRRS